MQLVFQAYQVSWPLSFQFVVNTVVKNSASFCRVACGNRQLPRGLQISKRHRRRSHVHPNPTSPPLSNSKRGVSLTTIVHVAIVLRHNVDVHIIEMKKGNCAPLYCYIKVSGINFLIKLTTQPRASLRGFHLWLWCSCGNMQKICRVCIELENSKQKGRL